MCLTTQKVSPKISKHLKVQFRDDDGNLQIGRVKRSNKYCYTVNVNNKIMIISKKEVLKRI